MSAPWRPQPSALDWGPTSEVEEFRYSIGHPEYLPGEWDIEMGADVEEEGEEQRAGREPTPVAGAQAEEEMEGRTQGPVARPTREPTPTTGAEQRAGHEPMPVADNESDDLKVYDESIKCMVCDFVLNGPRQYDDHLKGRYHRRKWRQLQQAGRG